MVDPIHSTSSAVQTYHHLTSVSEEICIVTRAEDSSFIGKKPARSHITSKGRVATRSLIGHAQQGISLFTNVLQGHKTVVLVGCTIE